MLRVSSFRLGDKFSHILLACSELRVAEQLKLTHKLVPEHLAKELKPKIDAARASLAAEVDGSAAARS